MASKTIPTTTKLPAANSSLPKAWRMVRFGDVVRDVTEAERNPLDVGLERYVGLEHIEPENLHLKQWGNLADSDVSFTKRFRKGQVLFGKRRAYQRKVAIAEFDGVCSSDILTFEPKNDDLVSDLLPFIVQSEGFFEHALGTSSGSLSPRTRWSQLQDYEFPLPPKDEQRRIAEILLAVDHLIEASSECLKAATLARQRFITESLDKCAREVDVPLRELWTESPNSGYSPSPAPQHTGHHVLILSALSSEGYRRGNLKPVVIDERIRQTVVKNGDLLVSRSNTVELVGLAGIFDEDRDDVSFPDLMMRVRVDNDRILTKYLELVLLSKKGRQHMQRVAAGTSGSMKKINRVGLGALQIPLPSISLQQQLIQMVLAFDAVIEAASSKLRQEQGLKQMLSNSLLRFKGA